MTKADTVRRLEHMLAVAENDANPVIFVDKGAIRQAIALLKQPLADKGSAENGGTEPREAQ